ncbi:MAG TPA: adenylate/guanylate cyclase domain-containing protein [Candidatus Tectomicrobia bacterium]
MRTWLARVFPYTGTIVGLLLTVIVWQLFVLHPPLLQRLELLASDWRFRTRGPRTPGPEVVIAAIDEKSIDQLGRWPWPYTVQARLVDRLTEYGAAVIGYDVNFSSSNTSPEADNLRAIKEKIARNDRARDPELVALVEQAAAEADHDRIFADALRRSERTVLGYFFHFSQRDVAHLSAQEMERALANIRYCNYNAVQEKAGARLQDIPLAAAWDVEANLPSLSQAAAGCGFFSNVSDADGAFRRYPLIVKYRTQAEVDYLFAPLGIRLLERYIQGNTNIVIGPGGVEKVMLLGRQNYQLPTDARGNALINHLGPGGTFPQYSIVDIVEGRPEAPLTAFAGKIVLVGATAEAVKDLRVTPFDPVLPGVELHATIIDNVLRRDFLVQPWWGNMYAGGSALLLGLCLTFWLPRLAALWTGIVTALLLLGSVTVNYVLFAAYGLWLSITYPLLAIVAVSGGMTLYHYVVEEKDKRFLHKTFGTYLSPALIEQMVQSKAAPRLGGSSGIRTAYFTDIASFSSFSEVLTATKLVELLNEYLTAMTDLLLAEGGTLDKYEGDAILAFFGAPIPQPDHAARALRVALGMQQALARLRQKWSAEGDKWPDLVKQMRMRIGISSGEIVIGNMGSTMRMDYTMMGDVVNTAARLEAAAKQYGIYIQCTTDTLHLAGPEDFEWRQIDNVRVVGKSEPIASVEIMALKGQLPEELVLMRDIYHQGLELYRQQKWDEAKAAFARSEQLEEVFPKRPTTPSRVFLERCDFFKANPPGQDWDGTWTLTSK